MQTPDTITIRSIFVRWFPLALSFELMMLEGPFVQSAIGKLPNSSLNLAAFGLCMGLSLIIESPVIMLLSTAIALVHNLTVVTHNSTEFARVPGLAWADWEV